MRDATTQHIPADVRERVAFEAFAWEHGRRGADAEWIRAQWQGETPKWRAMYFDLADRILAILRRTTRAEEEAWCAFLDALGGFEGEAAAMSASLSRALAAMQAAWIEWRRGRGADAAMQWIENTLIGPGLIPGDDESDAQAFFDRAIAEIENHQIRDAAALRSQAQGDEADALDLIRWAEARAVALEPVAGNIMPPGTYACYAGDAGEPYMGPGILGAIRAARRGEGGSNGLE